jgi:hypothetical protein
MLWLPRKPYEEPDAIEQVAVHDVLDRRGREAYNALLAQNGRTLEILDIEERHVAEKKTFDRQGIEVDFSPAQLMVRVRYRIGRKHHQQGAGQAPADA